MKDRRSTTDLALMGKGQGTSLDPYNMLDEAKDLSHIVERENQGIKILYYRASDTKWTRMNIYRLFKGLSVD